MLNGCFSALHASKRKTTKHIKKVGETNVKPDFLSDTSTDTVIQPSKNGKKKKCAVILRDTAVPEEIVQELYRGTLYDIK